MARALVGLIALLAPAWSELASLPEDCEESECSLSLRQLRGEQTLASVAVHKDDQEAPDDGWGNMTQEAWEEKQGGLCCFSGDDPSNVCGTCFESSIASYKNSCSRKSSCASCGGSWCEPKCVMGAADPNDKCGTAFETGTAKSDTFCGKTAKNCASCNGEWCKRGVTKPAVKAEESEKVQTVNAASSAQGFCCYRGDAFAQNVCGACADVSQDAACASAAGCSKCGGSWCAGPKCIKAFKDKADPCSSAFGHDSVASAEEYCSGSKEHCDSCHGAWCEAYNITFVTGEKFDPDHPFKTPSDEDEDAEDVEEVEDPEGAETIADLFPDGLAKKA